MPLAVTCPACGADGTAAANKAMRGSTPPPAPVWPCREPDAFVELDFARTFPHAFWVSSVCYDGEAPDGFRFKMYATRREPEMFIELLLLRERANAFKRKVFHKRAPLDRFAATGEVLEQIERDKNVIFERYDLSQIRTLDDFRAVAIELGWETAHGE